MVALDPWRGHASALVVPLGHATLVVDHYHAIRLANTVVDQVRRSDPSGHPRTSGSQA
jgi:transposase